MRPRSGDRRYDCPMATFDLTAFRTALDAHRAAAGLTWRDVATQAGVSPSTLTRIGQGRSLDMASFAALVGWLGLGADTFIRRSTSESVRPADPLAAAVLLLRDDPRLDARAAEVVVRVLAAVHATLAV